MNPLNEQPTPDNRRRPFPVLGFVAAAIIGGAIVTACAVYTVKMFSGNASDPVPIDAEVRGAQERWGKKQ